MAGHKNRRAARARVLEEARAQARAAGLSEAQAEEAAANAKKMYDNYNLDAAWQRTSEANLVAYGNQTAMGMAAVGTVAQVVPVYGTVLGACLIAGAGAVRAGTTYSEAEAAELEKARNAEGALIGLIMSQQAEGTVPIPAGMHPVIAEYLSNRAKRFELIQGIEQKIRFDGGAANANPDMMRRLREEKEELAYMDAQFKEKYNLPQGEETIDVEAASLNAYQAMPEHANAAAPLIEESEVVKPADPGDSLAAPVGLFAKFKAALRGMVADWKARIK